MAKAFVILWMLVGMQYTHAQTFLSLQYEIAEPTETFRDAAGTGSGVRAAYMHFISQRVAIAGSVGYIKWGARSGTPLNTEYKFVSTPVHLGVDFLLSRGVIAPYLGLSVGMDYLRMRTA